MKSAASIILIAFISLYFEYQTFGQFVITDVGVSCSGRGTGIQYMQASPASSYPLINLLGSDTATLFKSVGSSIYNGGIAKGPYWFRFSIYNSSKVNTSLYISIDNPRLNDISCYQKHRNSFTLLENSGDRKQFNSRRFHHRNFVFNTQLSTGSTSEYFLYIDQTGHTLTVPVKVFTPKGLQMRISSEYLLNGITFGILAFACFFSLSFCFSTKQTIYLVYTFYILSAILWIMSYFGLGFQFIWSQSPSFNAKSAPFFACVNLALNLLIARILLQLRLANRLVDNAVRSFSYLLLAVAGITLLLPLDNWTYIANRTYLTIFLALVIISMLMLLYCVIFYTLKGSKAAKLYLIASLIKVGGIIQLALVEYGLLPVIYDLDRVLQVGIVLEIGLLTSSMARRYAMYKIKSFKQIINAQEQERKRIAQDLHDSIGAEIKAVQLLATNLPNPHLSSPEALAATLKQVSEMSTMIYENLRSISQNLMPDYVVQFSLVQVLKNYISHTNMLNPSMPVLQKRISFSHGPESMVLSHEAKIHTFRIIQELITNIHKHSRATSAEITLSYTKKELIIIAEDNGIGIYKVGTDSLGLGLSTIKARLEILGGHMSITSPLPIPANDDDPNRCKNGTQMILKIPYKNFTINKIHFDGF